MQAVNCRAFTGYATYNYGGPTYSSGFNFQKETDETETRKQIFGYGLGRSPAQLPERIQGLEGPPRQKVSGRGSPLTNGVFTLTEVPGVV